MTTYRAGGPRRYSTWLVAAIVLVALAAGVGVGVAVSRSGAPTTGTAATSTTTSPGGSAGTTLAPAPALSVVSMQPAANATGVAGTTPVSITFSAAIAADSPTPTLSPPVAGSWHASGTTFTFTPTGGYVPLSTVTVEVPSGSTGIKAAGGGILTSPATESFRVGNGNVVRLQQLLSLLAYSPLAWTPSGASPAATDSAAQLAAVYQPPAGTFAWTDRGWPHQLRAMWQPGVYNLFTRGLVMSFEADHNLPTNAHVDSTLWNTLLEAVASNDANTGGYDFALAQKGSPELFRVWHDGKVVVRSSMNTGIATSPTPDGTYAVYTRLRKQVMRGTNPSGSHYADLVQYIAYFHGNDAVHYMDRADYGIPQSLGCIELPLASAAKAWPYLAYGTLVMVTG